MRDELDQPLGLTPTPAPLRTRWRPLGAWAARIGVVAAIVAAGGLAWRASQAPNKQVASVRFEDVAAVEPVKPLPPPALVAPTPSATVFAPPSAGGTVNIVRNGETPPVRGGPQIIDVAQALGRAAAPSEARLSEPSKWGALPRIGPDGARPSRVYARPYAETEAGRGAPRIALFVGGLGLDSETTRDALQRLPPDVSLGFAPYGGDLVKTAQRAREAGHELWLQAPMEGVAGDAPGPHTLTTAATVAENRESLHWLMARFPGYVGVAGYLGGKLTANSDAFSPILSEVGKRGLLYFDDGSSPLSKAEELAPGLDVTAARGDVNADADPQGAAVDAALDRAEEIARRRGSAIVSASALPTTLDRLARWTKALSDKGFALVPLSALAGARPDRAAKAAP